MLGCCADKQFCKGCTPDTCMVLPDGKTCGDCVQIKRCLGFGFTDSKDRNGCDFFPRRFAEVQR